MIEVIYKEEKQEGTGNEQLFCIPRNIRQIGFVNGDCRVYLEDYVYTFLGRLSEKPGKSGESQGVLAVFTGESKWADGITYVFIRGALEIEDGEAAAEHIDFTEKVWTRIHEEQELYFPDQEIVGWFFSQPELPMESTDLFTKIHLKYFAGGEKILMLMDPTEKEDAVFLYENNFMARQEGYYLFYERNPQMQAYMMEKLRGEPTETSQEVPDEAVKAFRKIIQGRNKKQKEQPEEMEKAERPSVFSYAATACLVIAVLTVGGSFYRNYQEMQSLSEKADAVSMAAEGEIPAVETGNTGSGSQGKDSDGSQAGLLSEMSDFLLDGQADVKSALNKTGSSGEETEDEDRSAENGGESAAETGGKTDQGKASGSSGGNIAGTTAENSQNKSSGSSGSSQGAASENNTGSSQGAASGNSTANSQETASESSAGSSQGTASKSSTGSSQKTAPESSAGSSGGNTADSGAAGSQGSSAGTDGKDQISEDSTADETSGAAQNNGYEADEDAIYQEESDARKAKRRQALLEQQASQTASSDGAHTSYVIRPGDTLYEISMEKYGSMDAISEICRLNGISRDEIIYPGQIIVLP